MNKTKKQKTIKDRRKPILVINIVKTWMHVQTELQGLSLIEAVDIMNDSLLKKITLSRIREMARYETSGRGNRIPRNIRVYMSNIVMEHSLHTCGLTDHCIKRLDIKALVEMIN